MKNITKITAIALLVVVSACSKSVTNVYDYYIKNAIESKPAMGVQAQSKSRLLFRSTESLNKAQIEMVAYKKDTLKYLVLGSHKVAKAFYIHDSLYHFDVTDLYNKVRGDDFIRQMGDLSVFFTHVPSANITALQENLGSLKAAYKAAKPLGGETIYIDYMLSADVLLSFEKKSASQSLNSCTIWIGKRKHEVSSYSLEKAISAFAAFN